MTDTPIYDQLRAELNARREPAAQEPPRQRARATEKPATGAASPRRVAETTSEAGQPVSVWTLVNNNRRNRKP
ncbi:hypothetical protein [Actinocrispum sp. NPDC049592]|uniref:hypothetical protein n=1 Tax=Actinocrispum sp. NPDC049592 TaxID=3154835 RepID=UPI00341DE3F6